MVHEDSAIYAAEIPSFLEVMRSTFAPLRHRLFCPGDGWHTLPQERPLEVCAHQQCPHGIPPGCGNQAECFGLASDPRHTEIDVSRLSRPVTGRLHRKELINFWFKTPEIL